MHELGIAIRIADIASRVAHREGVIHVTGINVQVGELTGIVPDLLRFSFKIAAKDTFLENSELIVHTIPAIATCPICELQFTPDGFLTICPGCDTTECSIIKGMELNVVSIAVVES